ncbi:MAG: HD domain-containing protein [Pseudodesulfovibrio sp.]|uniref:Metal-dependent phosphohydrolase HD sub domain protein n=1 Tax=Pseudodesulfovibrio aespoeensis (strain ATCC 700646 / DSM 10631 / Aspo-2) TaxID=643562 RepID=E6VY47_PSEA9|nr:MULTISPECIES: HD domain-containing phosphohydrolase [Pseudodesulfovibrio]MBU4193145.1 HD domain-containing protein [Pseudomonadota bacterium]ADU63861.1 metal-dependent phosphohydrolase HD sub domain protein [Pseudodesulfovibrio aespoeensis Aspo-2]MBU4243793.1 HD domain-containing protein [Pseudomonadota bacterium]MBU4378569.1 HD domain-containing protein [Pseudomonadota bacterium]MBU4475264.1 HD domain-containing protein [Pseudomonadota bacterium]
MTQPATPLPDRPPTVPALSETYLQISPNILEIFPRFRPPVDLYLHDEAVGRVGRIHRAGARLGTEAQARVAGHALAGRLFLLREDYLVYAEHLSRKLGLVLVEDGLNHREVAEIFFLAFRDRVARFMDQPKRAQLDRLRGDIAILAEYLWADPCRVEFLTGSLHKDHDPAVHAVNTLFVGLGLFVMLSLGRQDGSGGLDRPVLANVALGLALHDLGMTNVPRFVTDKERYLVRRDRDSIERHIEAGLRMLDRLKVNDPVVRQCLEQHHERLDGSGYPRGLRGEAVSLPGRLCAVADSFCAMIGRRPYRDARVVAEAATTLVHDSRRYDKTLAGLLAVLVSRGVPACRKPGEAGEDSGV